MTGPKTINHDPDEPPLDRSGNTVYWASAIMLVLLWTGYLWVGEYDWPSVALGVTSGLFVAIWGIAVTGNKVPKWMRR